MSKYFFVFISYLALCKARYTPTWDSLDSRKNPSWYDEAKFGIFMHWGVYSVPSYGGGHLASEWFWNLWKGEKRVEMIKYMEENYPPGFEYADFGPMFKADLFDPNDWADLLAKSGAQYYVLTSKHHEGWTNWRSNVSWNWNSVDNGPHRDLVAELAQAVRNRTKVQFSLYFSLYEWFHPLYLKDKANNFATHEYVDEVMLPQLYDIVNTYKPGYIFTDGDWVATADYFRSREFLAWLYNDSPVKDTVVVNDRWGIGCRDKHGGVYTGQDRFHPTTLQSHKWENAMTADQYSWGYRREAKMTDMLSMEKLIYLLVSTVSCGGNMLMNVGPRADGTIDPFFQQRLTEMGEWLGVNGEAIYASKPWRAQNDSETANIWFTSKPGFVYATFQDWPDSGIIKLAEPKPTDKTQVYLLGYGPLKWERKTAGQGIVVTVPAIPVNKMPCEWAWVLRMSDVA